MNRPDNFAFSLLGDIGGNLGIVAAVTLPMLIGTAGLALDYMEMVNDQQVLQGALDVAAVSAVASLSKGYHDETTVKSYIANLVPVALGNSMTSTEKAEVAANLSITVKTTSTLAKDTYDLKLQSSFKVGLTPFSRLFGYSARPVAALSTAQSEYSSNALSLYVVIDRSGSMSFVTDTLNTAKSQCPNYTASNWGYYPYLAATSPCYLNKMGALKSAATSLFDELDRLENADVSDTVIRVGGVSFTDSMQTPTAITWGTSAARTYVSNFPSYPTGGTDMSGGMEEAYKSLTATTEATAQTSKGNRKYARFILLMTDGENTGASTTWNPAMDDATLATCTSARNAGISIYTVAFMAPANGKALLEACAGVSSNSYVANDMNSLVKAFSEIGTKVAAKATRIVN